MACFHFHFIASNGKLSYTWAAAAEAAALNPPQSRNAEEVEDEGAADTL